MPRIQLNTNQNRIINSTHGENIYFTIISPNFPYSVYLEWEVSYFPLLENKIPVYKYNVYRSQSPAGPWDLINPLPISDTFLLDTPIQLNSVIREYYYKVEALSQNLAQPITVVSTNNNLMADFHGLKRRRFLEFKKMKRDRRIQLFMFKNEVLILKLKHYGERCPDCYDVNVGDVNTDKCLTCYGTSFTGGYYTLVRVLGESSQDQVQKEIDTHGYSEIVTEIIMVQDSPRITRDDIVFELGENKAHKVINAQNTQLAGSVLSQRLSVTEIARDNIIYQYPFLTEPYLDLYANIEPVDFINSNIIS